MLVTLKGLYESVKTLFKLTSWHFLYGKSLRLVSLNETLPFVLC